MNKMVKHILVVAVIALVGATSFAQEREFTEEQRAQMEVQFTSYFEKLELSNEQKGPFEEVTKKYILQMQGLKNSNKGKLSKYKEYKSIIKNRNKEMKEILSEEQYGIYLEKQEEMQKKMKERNSNKS